MRANSTVFDAIRHGIDQVVALTDLAAHMPIDDPRTPRLVGEIFHLAAFQGAVGDWASSVFDWAASVDTPAGDDGPPQVLRLLPVSAPPDGAA